MFKETERYLKRLIKGKQKFTKMLVFTFLMTGSLGMAVPITPNANGEYIVNSSTGGIGDVNTIGSASATGYAFRVTEGGKINYTGDDYIISSNFISGTYVTKPLLILSESNSEFEGTGVYTNPPTIPEFYSEGNPTILFSVKNPVTGVYSSSVNQKVTLIDIVVASSSTSDSAVKVEASNNHNIQGAILNIIGTNSNNVRFSSYNNDKWLIKVEADDINNKYSELTVNVNGKANISGLVNKESKSILNINMNENSYWDMHGNRHSALDHRSTLNSLTLNKATLYVNDYITALGNKAIYFMKLTSDGNINDGTLTNNNGIIRLSDEYGFFGTSYEDVFTIEGNYHGNNGQIWVDTLWDSPGDDNGGNSQSDLVYITGNANGSTKVRAITFDSNDNPVYDIINGNVQQLSTRINSVPVVKVAGNSSPTTFIGTAKTAGAVEAQLTSRQVNGVWEYYWTIDPIGAIGKSVVTPGTTGGATSGGIGAIIPGTTSGGGSPTTKPIYIMSQPVSSYVLMPKINMEMGYSTIGTLHERRSENQILELENMNTDKGQIWTRVYGRGLNEKGKTRFGYESNLWGVQVGHDFKINEDEKGNKHLLGGYIAYNNTKTDFFDKYRAVNGVVVNDKLTGEGKSESISLGLTKTKYTEKGTYYDLVGQVSVLQNKYESRDGDKAKQKGYGVVLSAEVGKPFVISKNTEKESTWSFEPQAQLIYQYLNNKSFNDGLRKVEQEVNHGLRGRAGFRIAYNGKSENHKERTNSYYAVANIWHDFANNGNKYTKIGGDRINEEVGKTWGEIGLGAQAPVGEKSNLYIDTRYEHSLSDSNHKGYRATVGFKHTF